MQLYLYIFICVILCVAKKHSEILNKIKKKKNPLKGIFDFITLDVHYNKVSNGFEAFKNRRLYKILNISLLM